MTDQIKPEWVEKAAAAIDAEWMRPEHDCDGIPEACAERCPRSAYQRMGLDELRDAAAHVAADIARQAVAEAQAEVADAFAAWAAKNEIAKPPLDWAWFGEIARRYSPLYEQHGES